MRCVVVFTCGRWLPACQAGCGLTGTWPLLECAVLSARLTARARHGHQAHFPAQQPQAQARPRFSCPHGDCRWPQGARAPSCQGSQAPLRLTGPECRPPAAMVGAVVIHDPPLPTGGMRFPRIARVRSRAEFTQVFDGARRVAHPQLSLHWLCDGRPARLGLAVSRKVDPHAVGRNRIKRALREAFRQVRAQLAPGAYVVVARPAARDVSGPALRAMFFGVLQRAGALPPSVAPGTMPAACGPTTVSNDPPASSIPRPGAG